MRKPVLFICGALAAYSLWRWFSYSYLSSSFRKGLEDDNNDVFIVFYFDSIEIFK